MLDTLMTNAGDYIHTNPWLAIAAVFVGGVLTASSPCVLAMIPLMISFVAGGKNGNSGPLRAFGYSLVFVLGLSITFIALGMIAAFAGQMYGQVSGIWNWIVAVVCVVMGLHLMGVLKVPLPALFTSQPKTRGMAGALILGLLFGLVSAPCVAPILVVLLTYLAGAGSSIVYGGFLLLVYALGHCVLILIAGTSMGAAKKLLESRNTNRVLDILRRAAGAMIVLIGGYFAYVGMT